MFDMGWTELLVIGVVALIVVGPKDLPKMFRTLGQMTAKARSMAREFSRAMEDAADASGVKDVARDLRGVADPKGMGLDEFNKMKNWDPLKDSPKQKPRADAKDAAPAPNADEDEDEMDRISAEMERLRTESKAKRAQADAPAADAAPQDGAAPDKPAQDTDSRA